MEVVFALTVRFAKIEVPFDLNIIDVPFVFDIIEVSYTLRYHWSTFCLNTQFLSLLHWYIISIHFAMTPLMSVFFLETIEIHFPSTLLRSIFLWHYWGPFFFDTIEVHFPLTQLRSIFPWHYWGPFSHDTIEVHFPLTPLIFLLHCHIIIYLILWHHWALFCLDKSAQLQNPPPHTNKVAIAVAFCYVWGCIISYINFIQPNQ